jgi:hypothetical protein
VSLSVEDQLAIQQLYARYNHAIDSGNAEAWADTFTGDGAFSSSASGDLAGREALVAFAKAFSSRLKARHWTNNLVVEPAANGASGTCYLIFLRLAEGQPATIAATGLYRDELVNKGQGWRFARRSVVSD